MADTPAQLKRKEAELVRRFLVEDTHVWEWLRGHLERQLRGLQKLTGRFDITADQRAMLCGQQALIATILDKPAELLAMLEEAERQVRPDAPPAPKRRPLPSTPTKA